MRKVVTLLFICFSFLIIEAQTSEVFIKINHKAGTNDLVLETGKYSSWNNVPFYYSRLQYYVSGIYITHDGGQVTAVTDKYLLVDPLTNLYSLGVFDIQEIEKLDFNIGVSSKINHGDPSLYPPGHPLSFQNPSMHWGWAAGYNFAAIEGYSDSGDGVYNDKFELHPIGDKLYTNIVVDVKPAKDINGNPLIELDADYNKLFNTIDLTGGIINHGDFAPNPQLMLNFKEVFTDVNATTSTVNPGNDIAVTCCNSSSSALILYSSQQKDVSFNLYNTSGNLVYQQKNLSPTGNLQLPDPLPIGMYFMSFNQKGKVLYTGKVVIQY